MSSIGEGLMAAVLARLQGSPSMTLDGEDVEVRRKHRTVVAKEDAPMCHLVDGDDIPNDTDNECDRKRQKYFTVSLFVRDDNGASAADPLVLQVNARLDPATPYGDGKRLRQGPITVDEEIADGDAIRIDMQFRFLYDAPGWSLEA